LLVTDRTRCEERRDGEVLELGNVTITVHNYFPNYTFLGTWASSQAK
jgi:hypothetical protein